MGGKTVDTITMNRGDKKYNGYITVKLKFPKKRGQSEKETNP